MRRPGDDIEVEEEYNWCPESAFWGTGANYMIHYIEPEQAGFRRPIGFLADIDTPVETWETPSKKKVKKSVQEPSQPTVPKPVL